MWLFGVQEEVRQQYVYIQRLESVVGSMQRERLSRHLRADLQLLHLGKVLPGEGQRLAALKARSAIAARCQQAFLVSALATCIIHDCRSSEWLCSC